MQHGLFFFADIGGLNKKNKLFTSCLPSVLLHLLAKHQALRGFVLTHSSSTLVDGNSGLERSLCDWC
jgi:hypothetical protein